MKNFNIILLRSVYLKRATRPCLPFTLILNNCMFMQNKVSTSEEQERSVRKSMFLGEDVKTSLS